MAQGTDNPAPISDGATYYITDPLGRRQLRQVESHNANPEGGLAVVTGPSGIIGRNRSAGGHAITLTVRHARTVRDEVAWDVLQEQDIDIVFEIQFRGGMRLIYRKCGVSTVSNSADNSGNVTFEVALVAEKKSTVQPDA